MTSLVPGPLFGTPGLNRNSTPTPYNTTPRELDEMYSRGDSNGIPWPHDSPTNGVYDVRNSSTKMIILNNKYGQNGTRLRGYYSGPRSGKSKREVNPKRHETVSSPVNMELHGKCHDSSSPRFEPDVKTDIEWINQSQRQPNSLTVKSTVNPKRHAACQVPRLPNPDNPDSRPVSRRSFPPKRYFTEFPELSVGEKIYLWSIERIYNVDHLKKQKQEQYRKLLEQEAKKGYHGFEEYTKYLNYIRNASKRTFGMASPGIPRNGFSRSTSPRSRSAVSRSGWADGSSKDASKSGSVKDEEAEKPVRPHTSIPRTRTPAATKTKRAASAKSEGRKHTASESKHKSSSSPKRSPYLPQRPKSVPALKLKSKSSLDASNKSTKQRQQDKEDNSDTSSLTDKGETTPSLHREGIDRPKSRLGRHVPPKDKVIQKPDVKADEYSDGSDHEHADTSIAESKTGELNEDTKEIGRKASTIGAAENVRGNEDIREDATGTGHKKEDTTEKDHKATQEFKPSGDVQLDIADETLSEMSRSARSSYEQTEDKTKEHKAPEDDTTDTKNRDNMLFAKLGRQDGDKSSGKDGTDGTDIKRDHDNKSVSSSVSSASSRSSRPSTADTETSRSVRQEQVEITTNKRQHVHSNSESDITTEMGVTEVVKGTSEAGENHDKSNTYMTKDEPVFITEPSNVSPKGSQNDVSNQFVNDETQNENIKRKSDSGQSKESINNAKQAEGENDSGSSMRKLIRQDSLDDDDEERRASKDIDNMKY